MTVEDKFKYGEKENREGKWANKGKTKSQEVNSQFQDKIMSNYMPSSKILVCIISQKPILEFLRNLLYNFVVTTEKQNG